MAWVAFTIAAAFFQNLRSLLQKRLTGTLSVLGATYIRFIGALPFALLYVAGVTLFWHDGSLPGVNRAFFLYCVTGAVAQIGATFFLLAAFRGRNFGGATALSKTETLQAALYGFVLLGDEVTGPLLLALPLSLAGVFLLGGLRLDRSAWLGLLAGAAFAVATVAYRGAALALDGGDYVVRAAVTLSVNLLLQTLLMGAFLAAREPHVFARLWANRGAMIWVGFSGALASIGWFTAMTLVSAALVRVVGQVELVFAFATSVWLFGERVRPREIVGAILIVAGILLLV